MTQEGKFGVGETISLVSIAMISKMFCTCAQIDFMKVGTTGWYMIVISGIIAALGFTFCYLLLKRFPGKNLLQIYDITFGNVIGFIFSLLLAILFLSEVVIYLREFTDIEKVYAYRDSPPVYIMLFVILTIIVLSFLGLEAIVRYSKFIGYFIFFGLIAGLLLASQNYQVYRLFPILGHGLGATFVNALKRSFAYGEIFFVAVFACSLQSIRKIKKAGYLSLLVGGAALFFIYLSFNLTFAYPIGDELTSPIYVQSTLIEYGGFFQRVEPLLYFVWIITTLISLIALFYAALFIYTYIFRLKDKRPLIIPLSIIVLFLSLIPDSLATMTNIAENILLPYAWILFFTPPIIALIIAKIRKKGGRTRNAQ
ncbi:MAG: spore germination protein [Actinobacteria bacterium]|nr:spore germination protein [Actinomycetota bacterium]